MWRINLYHLALKVPKQYHVVMVVTMMITVLMTILRVVPGAGKNLLSKSDSYSPHWWVLLILVKFVKNLHHHISFASKMMIQSSLVGAPHLTSSYLSPPRVLV